MKLIINVFSSESTLPFEMFVLPFIYPSVKMIRDKCEFLYKEKAWYFLWIFSVLLYNSHGSLLEKNIFFSPFRRQKMTNESILQHSWSVRLLIHNTMQTIGAPPPPRSVRVKKQITCLFLNLFKIFNRNRRIEAYSEAFFRHI